MRNDFAVAALLEGGGEMGALLRDKDWSKTPLGPMDGWPQSLRSTVSVMLAAPEVSYLFWGADLAILYNDCGRPIVGEKHPACLGLSIREVLMEAWPTIGPLVDGVMSTGKSVYLQDVLIPLERSGLVQDNYFTCSYIPVRIENGEVGGILVMAHETTALVLGARRLAMLREQSLRAAVCQTVAEVLGATEEVLGQSPDDLPFALLYELEGKHARLVICAGLERNLGASRLLVEVGGSDALGRAWPIADVAGARAEILVEDVKARFGVLVPGGAAGDPVERALLIPLVSERERAATHVLIAGLNPRRLLDADAESFLQHLARQISSTIAGAHALEEKTERTAELAELDRKRAASSVENTEQLTARALRESEERNRAKDEFLATMGHELRTPLNAMLGWTRILQTRAPDEVTLGKGLAVIERNALTQARLVDDLLDVSRIISGKLNLAMRRVDPAEPVLAAVDVVRPAADAKRVHLVTKVPRSVGWTVGDADRLQQIIWNLLTNAVRFTPSNGTITISMSRDDSAFQIVVKDTGAGIPPAHLPFIFERFRQVDASTTREYGGLGLGLAIVRYLVEAHGGTVSARSDGPGLGATFEVTLPVRAVWAPQEGAGADRAAATVGRLPDERKTFLQNIRVLGVDDNEDSLDLIRELLTDAGASFVGVKSAEEALEACGPFDLIISDIGMPQIDGYTFLHRIRSRDSGVDVPAIALTAYARAADVERALGCGYSDHLAKPIEADELLLAVKRWSRR